MNKNHLKCCYSLVLILLNQLSIESDSSNQLIFCYFFPHSLPSFSIIPRWKSHKSYAASISISIVYIYSEFESKEAKSTHSLMGILVKNDTSWFINEKNVFFVTAHSSFIVLRVPSITSSIPTIEQQDEQQQDKKTTKTDNSLVSCLTRSFLFFFYFFVFFIVFPPQSVFILWIIIINISIALRIIQPFSVLPFFAYGSAPLIFR